MSTVADIYALPDGERAELIDGVLYGMAPPGYSHQELSLNISAEIRNYIRKKKGNCKVIAAPFAVFLNNDDKTYLEPDIIVVCDVSKIDEKGCHGAPDLIVEILSPSSRSRDRIKKFLKYATAGVREYWIVDPVKKQTDVYHFEKDLYDCYGFGESIPAGIFDDLQLTIEEIL